MRVPTDEEYNGFTGRHCSNKWKKLGEDWTCPVCGRTKRQVMRWNVKEWTIGLHKHHDHSTDVAVQNILDYYNWSNQGTSSAREYRLTFQRFPDTTICGGCNTLDARIKKLIGAESAFSFSPDELKESLNRELVKPNAPIPIAAIDLEKAKSLYVQAKSSRYWKVNS